MRRVVWRRNDAQATRGWHSAVFARTSKVLQGCIKLRSGAGFQPATAGILPATIIAAAKNWFLLTALGLEAPLGRLEACSTIELDAALKVLWGARFPVAGATGQWVYSPLIESMNEWNIQARSHHCQACEKAFLDKQVFHTLLFDEKHDFRRMDICEPCWQAQYSQGASDRKGFVSYWHGVYEAPQAAPPDAIQKENAESLLRKLIELNDPKYIAVGFILAVMLERKRLLKVKEQIVRDGQRVFVYEHPQSGDVFTISDPNLQLTQLEQVQHDVAHLLEHGFNPVPAPLASEPPGEVEEKALETPAEAPS